MPRKTKTLEEGIGGESGEGAAPVAVTHDVDPEAKKLIPPDDQVKLTDLELKAEFTRILTCSNPQAPQNIVRYSFMERVYKQQTVIDQLAVHYIHDAGLIHLESEEALKQIALGRGSHFDGEEIEEELAEEEEGEGEGEEDAGEGDEEMDAEEDEDEEEEEEGMEGGDEDMVAEKPHSKGGLKEKKLTNQFNFSERASQTYNNTMRDHSTITEPPPRITLSDNVSQWEIYDAYQKDYEQLQRSREQTEKQKRTSTVAKPLAKRKKSQISMDIVGDEVCALIGPSVKILERMINQNTYDDVAQDFKYYEDGSDEFKDQEGSLLPLWKFTHEKVKKLAITCIAWSPKYMDLFAVGHGSYDFKRQFAGMILLYSLKNPSYPEFIFECESGVMSLDINPTHPYLVAVGFYDGNVGVYSLVEGTEPMYMSTATTGKHIDPVWDVRWMKENLDDHANFYSTSSDGRVVCWTIIKDQLEYQDILHLPLEGVSKEGPNGTQLDMLAGGTTFDFHTEMDHIFLIGTEEGRVHVCCKSYSTTFLDTYVTHSSAVYRVAWNPYHARLFITCGNDWMVKIWDRTTVTKEPVFMYDLGISVGDVAWAPYSSTIFAAVTSDGKVHVFDLNINKYESICEQLVSAKKKTKLTHISFNNRYPLIVVGDDRGCVMILKLSPNLRKKPKEKRVQGQEPLKPEEAEQARREYEFNKMEKILSLVRQPNPKFQIISKEPKPRESQ